MSDKIHEIRTEPDAMLGALEALRRHSEAVTEYQKLLAPIRRAAYLAHVEAGFTEAQAIELVKKII